MTIGTKQALFDGHGRRLPFEGMRVFEKVSRRYYQFDQPDVDFDAVLNRIYEHAHVGSVISPETFKAVCLDLLQELKDDASLAGILNGVHVPFVCPQMSADVDIGEEFEKDFLAAVGSSFVGAFPQYHFKATVQGDLGLGRNLRVAEGSRYEHFLNARRQGVVVGWYFPGALQAYDVASQRSQMATLPLPESLVLSGGFDAAVALAGSPDLLMNRQAYPPVLCLSGFQHTDKRLMLCFKAYGQSLEFWCLSQMLTPTTTQVSEQWAGGLTCFTAAK